MTKDRHHGAESKGKSGRGRPEEASGPTSHASKRKRRRRSSSKEASGSRGGGLLDGRSGVATSPSTFGASSSRTNLGDHGSPLLRGEDKGLRKTPAGGDGWAPFPPGDGALGDNFGGDTSSPLPRLSGVLSRPSLPSRLQPRDHGRQIHPWSEGATGQGPAKGRMDEELREGRGRSGTRRRPARVEADGAGVKADSWPEGSPEERRGFSQPRFKGQKEERKERQEGEEEKGEEGKEGKEEAGGLREWGLLDGEAQWSSTIVGLGEEGQITVRRDRPGRERKSEETRESSSSKVLEEREKGQELFQPEFNKFGVEQSPGGGSQGWSLHGDLKGKGGRRALPRSTCPRSTSNYGGSATTREGGELGDCQRQTNSFPLLQATAGQAAEWPSLTGGGHLGHVDGFFDEGASIPRDGCPCSETEVDRSVSIRVALAGVPTDGACSPRADADCKAGGNQRSSKRDIRRGEDAVAFNPSPRRKGEREGPGWKVQPERRWKEGWQGRQRWRQAEGRQEGEVRSYEEREDSWAPTGGLLSSRYDGTSMSAAGKGGVDVEELGSRPEMAEDPGCVTIDRPPVTNSGAGFSVQDGNCGIPPHSGKKDDGLEFSFEGQRSVVLKGLGSQVLQKFLEALPLRSKPTGSGQNDSLFPIPTSRNVLQSRYPDLDQEEISWFSCVCLGLNSLWGGDLFNEGPPSSAQAGCLDVLVEDISRLKSLTGEMEGFDWSSFFRTRTIDYQGDEVKVALWFRWGNVSPALPREIGVIPLEDVCQHGALYYVKNIDLFLKDKDEWPAIKPPKVMVHDEDWPAVCNGLCQAGVCTLLTREEVFDTGDGPLLNGLFGVSKEETCDGEEVHRLIMNLIPLNGICHGLSGDVGTLPAWSSMSPFFLQPTENLLVSSEDVRCFFYVMSVPVCWYKFLAFNKQVPDQCLPPHLQGCEVYLASKVLPMGFLNSVSLAQHVHRNLVLWSGSNSGVNAPEQELRKDKQFPNGELLWRVYLDNYDLLEKVEATKMVEIEGTLAAPVLALREQYEVWGVPRNVKKAAERKVLAEVQGAMVDGERGIAFPRESKLLKYVGAALRLCSQRYVSQRQMQVVCGGLVYMAMFRRPLLGGLNAVWRQIEDFNSSKVFHSSLWSEARFEILRFICLMPLARLDFRLGMHPQITCSDASSSGGGICASVGLTHFGDHVSRGKLRGQHPESRREGRLLSIGLFDGVGALRVALDLLGIDVAGHISVEQSRAATRVVEASFPSVISVQDVCMVDLAMVREKSLWWFSVEDHLARV